MALSAHRPAIFVGTAKSVYVAPYGRLERTILARASRVFVRDRATAAFLSAHGVQAEAPGNVIADLAQSDARFEWRGRTRIVVLPGSRDTAYVNAHRIGRVLERLDLEDLDVAVSVAPGIDAAHLTESLGIPARMWDGVLGALFADATLAFGQAGTANEAAAASGLAVVALANAAAREDWYRMRQRRLLDGALAVLPAEPDAAAAALRELLRDGQRLAHMGTIGRERMGAPGGARLIARGILEIAEAGPAV
jgi:hypothetical protein